VVLVDEPRIRFVHPRAGCRVTDSFPSKLTRRDPPELLAHERQQLTERAAIATAPVSEKRRHNVTRGHELLSGFGESWGHGPRDRNPSPLASSELASLHDAPEGWAIRPVSAMKEKEVSRTANFV
jgi:hypothetical protein